MIIERLSPNAIIHTVSRPPDIITMPWLLHDVFSYTSIVRNIIGYPNEIFDLRVFNFFKAQARPEPGSKRLFYEFKESEFSLGKFLSEEQDEKDELHVTNEDGELAKSCKVSDFWIDVEAHTDYEVLTLIQVEVLTFDDVTNYNNYLCK